MIPPAETWTSIQAVREIHDRQVRRWMPHITLVYPFRPRAEFDGVSEALSAACVDVAPFQIKLAEFRSFEHKGGGCTVWLSPEPIEDMVKLQTSLWEAVPDCDEVRKYSGGFTPHLSVGQATGREKSQKLIAALQDPWEPLTFRAEEVSLIWRDDTSDDRFRVAKHISLGTGKIEDEVP